MRKILLLIFIIILCNGCSRIFNTFIRNYSANPIILTIKCEEGVLCTDVKNKPFRFTNTIIKMDRAAYVSLKSKLIPASNNIDDITIEVPPQSTVYLNQLYQILDPRAYPFSVSAKITEGGVVTDSLRIFNRELFTTDKKVKRHGINLYYDYHPSGK